MVTNMVKNKATTIPAGEFKARCLQLMDSVARTGERLIITKRGRPVAQLAPLVETRTTLRGFLQGSVRSSGDLLAPIDVEWDAAR